MSWASGRISGIAGHGVFRTAPESGVPFAGIPDELRAPVESVLETEPEHALDGAPFTQRDDDRRPLTVRSVLAPHKRALAVAGLLVAAETATMQAGPLLTQIGIDNGIRTANAAVVAFAAGAYVVSAALNWILAIIRARWTARVGEHAIEQLRLRVFAHLQRLSIDFYERELAGRIISRMTSDIEAMTQLFHEGLVQFVVQALMLVVIAIVLVVLSPVLAAITLLGVVPVMAVLTIWFRARSDVAYRLVRDRITDVVAHLAENLAGIRVVTAHNRHRHNIIAHRNLVGSYRRANHDTARLAAMYSGGSELLGVAGQAFILAVGGVMVLRGSLTLGTLVAFLLYLTQFFAPIQQLVQVYNSYQRGQAGLFYLRAVLALEPSVPQLPDAVELPPIKGAVTLEGVTFAYSTGSPVLHDVDLRIASGETVAFVGPTGAGKSTIAKLITRQYDATEGRVTIDGQDVRDVTFASLRRQLGVVPQEPFLFAGSIRDNIAFARPDASDDELRETCRAVGLEPLLSRLPDGWDTPCHERGVSLSAGERQLLALARAFVARPQVLILDEATSNLDLQSEAIIERALDVVVSGRTAIIIAHRLATAMRADRIAVIDEGRVVEAGTHAELVAAGGRYAALYATWIEHGGVRTTA
jgi:ATP-binding cassette subfamily B protein